MKLSVIVATVFALCAAHVQSFVPPTGSPAAVRSYHAHSDAKTTTGFLHNRRGVSVPNRTADRTRGRRSGSLGMATTVVPADFKLPIGIASLGLAVTGAGNIGAGFSMTVVGLLLAFQATRISFMFDNAAMEVMIGDEDGKLESSGENAFVGGQSRWNYDTWTNWEVYPTEALPVLFYFKETQTKPEGQIHFFPFIMEPAALLEEVRARVPLAK